MNPKVIVPIIIFLVLAVIGIIVAVVVTSSSSAAPGTAAPGTAAPAPKNDGGTNAAKMEIPTMRDLTGVDASSFTVNSLTDAITRILK
jgi:flagellar basal body-associated protein FliL